MTENQTAINRLNTLHFVQYQQNVKNIEQANNLYIFV